MIKGTCVPIVGCTDILDYCLCQAYDLCSQICFFSPENTAGVVINIILSWISVSVRTGCFSPSLLGGQSDYHVSRYKSLKWRS